MPRNKKNKKNKNKHLFVVLPITTALFPKKIQPDRPQQNALDFHLDIIERIDKLLAEQEKKQQADEPLHAPLILTTPHTTPIESRPPLNKTLSHQEISWEPQLHQHTPTQTIPEEFKTELHVNPEFRFITKQELIETLSQIQPEKQKHIEIIDLPSLAEDDPTIQKTIDFRELNNQPDETPGSFLINEGMIKGQHHNKIEIIDANALKNKKFVDVFNASTKQAEQIDTKAKLFFLNKSSSGKKDKSVQAEQAYIPDDFEERWKKLKEKQSKEEQKEEGTMNKFFKDDSKKIEEIVVKKPENHDKKQGFFHQEKKIPNTIQQTKPNTINTNQKELEKEQLRLQKLEMRQARIEERLRKKREKHQLKIQQRQQQLKQKEEQKLGALKQKEKKQPQQLQEKEEPKKESGFKKETQSLEFDEDVKKVLLMTDILLEELPEDILTDFMHSEDFKLYAKVLNRFKAK